MFFVNLIKDYGFYCSSSFVCRVLWHMLGSSGGTWWTMHVPQNTTDIFCLQHRRGKKKSGVEHTGRLYVKDLFNACNFLKKGEVSEWLMV